MARQRPRATRHALAALLLGACACASAAVGVHGSSLQTASNERSGNAALRPQELPPSTPSLERAVEELLNKTADSLSIVNPFALTTATPTATAITTTEEVRAPTPTPTPTPTPSSSRTTETPGLTPERSTAEPLEAPQELDDDVHGSSYSGSGSMEAHHRSGRKVGPASMPGPVPSDDFEKPSDGGSATASTIKRTNVIAFDVITPQSVEDEEETTREETSRPPPPLPSAGAQPQPAPTPQPPAPTPTKPVPPQAPGATPPLTPLPASSSPPVTLPVAPGAGVPSSLPPAAAVPAGSVAPGSSSSSSLEPRSTSVAPGPANPATTTNQSSSVMLGDSVPKDSKDHASSAASSSHDPAVGQSAKANKDAAGSGSASTSTETSTTSESSYYSMGTASILSIVGVLVGICVIIALFVLISRREYEDDDDGDRDVLGYGGDGGFKIGDRPTIVRLSPTFLLNGAGPGVPGQPLEPDFSLPSPLQIMSSNRGATGSSRGGGAIGGSSRGYAPTGAVAEESPAILESSLPPPRGRGPSNEDRDHSSSSSSGGGGGGMFQHSDDISTLDSRGSDGWSSVMESDFDLRSASRCTRDTTFSNITMSQNLSELNAWDLTSQHQPRTGSGRGTFRNTSRRTGGSRGTTRSVPRMPEFDLDEEDDLDTSSVLSYDVDEGGNGKGARSTGFSSYRSSAESQFSDFRSTTGLDASRS